MLKKDALDDKILNAFAAEFPRPNTIFYCNYDVCEKDMLSLCKNANVVFEDPKLIQHFVWNNHLGFFGDWTSFPAFAGDIAVYARRKPFDSEWDLIMWYFHTSPHGMFKDSLHPVIREWILDVLSPDKTFQSMGWGIHYIGYLSIFGNVGGDINKIVQKNIEYSLNSLKASPLTLALIEYVEDKQEIFNHFSQMTDMILQQETDLPEIEEFFPKETLNLIINLINSYKSELQEIDAVVNQYC